MKKYVLIFCSSFLLFSCEKADKHDGNVKKTSDTISEKEYFTGSFKKEFEGVWQKETEYQTNTIKIEFESGKNYATVIDIGSGEAPPLKFKAFQRGNMLLIPPEGIDNYCELRVKNDQLIFLIPSDGKQAEVKIIFNKIKE
ncbi:hypothetical protein ACFQO9_03175 [Chryseobacterium zhengzhouense]|uniref:Lipocalin-like domain-containing protein n=1 Tax=Chryseobacterium zhengzhouense TaxID=1636086 RepID=A0ABW2LWM2_9FLAO